MEAGGIEEARARHESELLALPNVVGVGIGERDGELVILVHVDRKVAAAELAPNHLIPSSLEGFRVDVAEIGDVAVQAPTDQPEG